MEETQCHLSATNRVQIAAAVVGGFHAGGIPLLEPRNGNGGRVDVEASP